MKRLAILVLLPVAMAAPTPATALPPDPGSMTARLLDRAARILSQRSISQTVRAAAALDGTLGSGSPETPPAPVPGGVAPAITEPVGVLLGALEAAEDLAGDSIAADQRELDSLLARAADLLRRSQLDPENESLVREAARLEERTRDAVDHEALMRAAMVVAHALDRAVPALARAAASLPTAPDAAGCDVLDLPVLCIGNTGANTYTQDVALQIDLGGDDRYENSAGGADPVPTLGNGIPVSIAIDVDGDDTYAATFPLASRSRVAQGAGAVGGVGFLVDAEGDDTYLATGPAPKGQGMGYGGVGVLVDPSGTDTYTVHAAGSAGGWAQGQGTTLLGALGLLVDRGSSNDSYLVEAIAVPGPRSDGTVAAGTVNAYGQGAAYDAGVALLADDGGASSFVARGFVEQLDPTDARPTSLSTGLSSAQGASVIGGVGIALAGPGDSTWSSSIEIGHADAPELEGSSGVFSQGSGNLGAYGALLDAGGNDTYSTLAASHSERRVTVAAGSGTTSVVAYAPDLYNESQGLGYLGGAGILRDLEGNDAYTAATRVTAVAEVVDVRPGSPAEGESEATADAVSLVARTWSQGVSNLGFGFLHDHAGDDRYTADAESIATATATAEDDRRSPMATGQSERAVSWAQGAAQGGGHGQLLDLGGADEYRSTNVSTATLQPLGIVQDGEASSSVQGSSVGESGYVAGTASFADLGAGTDVFHAAPEDPTCMGARGQGYWVDCGPGNAVGLNQ